MKKDRKYIDKENQYTALKGEGLIKQDITNRYDGKN